MIIKTATKIAFARLAYRVLRPFAGSTTIRQRKGIMWDLELSEGVDFSIFALGSFEPETAKVLESLVRPGYTVLDIGANVGAHTLPLARAVGDSGAVHAFEPTEFAFGKLRRNLELNPELSKRVTALQAMLVERADQARADIYSSWPLETEKQEHPHHLGRRMSTRGARILRLDDWQKEVGIKQVDVIKIDVDGWEYPVLAGGIELLRRFRPKIVTEFAPYVHKEEGNSFDELVSLFAGLGYQTIDIKTGKRLPSSADELRSIIPDGASINCVAQPA